MSINALPVRGRTAAYDPRITANGSYTLPQYAFIPHPDLQQLSSGFVSAPGVPGASAAFAAPPGIGARPYPTPGLPIFGVRQIINYKSSP